MMLLLTNNMKLFMIMCIILTIIGEEAVHSSEDVNFPTVCHVCKHTVAEFLEELDNSEKSKEVLQLGHIFQTEKSKQIVYNKSDLRFIEALENTCQKINDYKVHKDKPNQIRYAKDESSTFLTLKALKGRGVDVDLGFPHEMWDVPDAEIYQLKIQCEHMIEKHEEDFNDWYYNHQEKNLYNWFCKDYLLKEKDQDCFKVPDSRVKSENKNKKETNKNDDLKIIEEENGENNYGKTKSDNQDEKRDEDQQKKNSHKEKNASKREQKKNKAENEEVSHSEL